MTLPILYSFRRCPYAMRARMAIAYSGVQVEHREVILSNKPKSILEYSPKGTVPVLVLPDQTVIDESRDIIYWALAINDPEKWALENNPELKAEANQLIDENDASFKQALDQYKYHVRFPKHPAEFYRAKGEVFLKKLNDLLNENKHLMGDGISIADIAIFPFVRQFSFVDKNWFDLAPYTQLQVWLDSLLQTALFEGVMQKHMLWKDGK